MSFQSLFGKKNKSKKEKSDILLKSEISIETKVNEVFSFTKVTQKILNDTKSPVELEIFINKYLNKIIFSSFYAQIGKSFIAKSKVIKEEKAEEKYTDSISSGNVGIYATLDKNDKDKIIVHIGNIPPNEELTFISEYIQLTESSNDLYEHELFRNLPTFNEELASMKNVLITGTLEIKLKNKITLEKKFKSKDLVIEEENFKENNTKFFLKYKYSSGSIDYIRSNKIYFKSDYSSNPMKIFSQVSSKNKKEKSFILNYKLEKNKSELIQQKSSQENLKLSPALFIFLLDQSGSMAGSPLKVASKALLLFLQSLPVGSYYQIIGFGSEYRLYDDKPKEYNQKNIQKSIETVEALKGDMGGTNIYEPLKYVYNSSKDYDKILLPRNIFLLTDGEIKNKNETLKLIEKNNNEYSVYSFGMGNSFDEDLIKNAGVIGKGSYSFCRDIKGLSQVIVKTLNNICVLHTNDLKIESPLDNLNLYELNKSQKIVMQNQINRYYYIIQEDKFDNKKMKFKMEYTQNNEKYSKNYEIEPIELIQGDELSKLIMYEYIKKEKNISEEEKIKLALKYQIFIEGTSLFAEVENSEKATETIKQEIIKKKEKKDENPIDILDKRIKDYEMKINNMELKTHEMINLAKEKLKNGDNAGAENLIKERFKITEKIKRMEGAMAMMEEQKLMLENTSQMRDVINAIKQGSSAVKEVSKGMSIEDIENMNEMEEINPNQEELKDFFKEYANEDDNKEYIAEIINELKDEINGIKKEEETKLNEYNYQDELDLEQFLAFGDIGIKKETKEVKEIKKEVKKEKEEIKKEEKKEVKKEKEEDIKLNLNNKDDIMKIINSQNFINGFWDINNKTKIIQKKYEKEFQLLKGKNIDDIIAMTIIIIYFINKEHKELIEELVMILKKAKLYIQDKSGDSYENIIQKTGIA